MSVEMVPLKGMDVKGKTVLLRLDINSPIDPHTKEIVSDNRLRKSLPTLQYLQDGGARTVILAHQGDTLDYANLISMEQHAAKLAAMTGRPVRYIDDVCGPAAVEAVKELAEGESVLLGNLRYLGEELSTFEKDVKLTAQEMCHTWLVRTLAPLGQLYVNDAFSAAHRNAPSMVAFQQLLPSAAGFLFFDEMQALTQVRDRPRKPTVFVLGGGKISDAFGMMGTVLQNGTADKILTCGVTGVVMLAAKGVEVGAKTMSFLQDRDLLGFVEQAKEYLAQYGQRIAVPLDVAVERAGQRVELAIDELPYDGLYQDIGGATVAAYGQTIAQAGTVFANGPAGVYENPLFDSGTKAIWQAVARSEAYSVIGGGDTVSSASRFIDLADISYVCTAGGAMVRFMSGKTLPLVAAMQQAAQVSR